MSVSYVPVNWSTLTFAGIPTEANLDWDNTTVTWGNSGYRLPTEMEWMWAAMGATGGTSGYLKGYAGSTEGAEQTNLANYAWYLDNGNSKTHPVGLKTPNELGLYDMSGNVWEWTWDWYSTIPTGAVTDYRGETSGVYRVRRGGGWNQAASFMTVAYRASDLPKAQSFANGFRVVRQ